MREPLTHRPRMIDPYLTDEEPFDKQQAIYDCRLWDNEGEDTAYDMGFSPVRKPAPKGGRMPDATDIFP